MGFLPVLFLVFLVLKLTGIIAWSWWIILIPLYPVFIILTVLGLGLLFGAAWTVKKFWR